MGFNFLYLFLCPFLARVSILHEKLHQTSDREHLTQDEILAFHEQSLEVSFDHRLSLDIHLYPILPLRARAQPQGNYDLQKDKTKCEF